MKLSLRRGLMSTAAIMTVWLPVAAHAQSTSDMQNQINDLSAQLKAISAKLQAVESHEAQERSTQAKQQAATNELKARQEHEEAFIATHNKTAQLAMQAVSPTRAEKQGVVNNQYVTKGVLPGSFLIPGTNTSIYIGGFVNFQAEYSPTQNLGPKFSIGNLEPNSPDRRATAGDFQFQSKVSRLVVQSSTPSPLGPITTNFGLDFYGYVSGGDYNQALQNNSYSARIVYAYGTVGPVTMGMLNSNFIDDPDTPETFDNGGPAGIPAERTEQIRYTWPVTKTSLLNFAVEDPQSAYQDTRDNIEVASKTEPMPDFSIRYEYTSDLLHAQLSGVLRDIAYTDGYGDRTSHITGAMIVGSTVNLGAINKVFGKDNIGGQVWTGSIGRYIPDDFGANVASVLAVNNGTSGTAKTIETKLQDDQGFTLFYQHYWSSVLRSTVAIGYNHQNLAAFLPADTQNAVATKTVHANLIWRIVPQVDLGAEFMIGQKQFQKSTHVTPKNAERVEMGGIWHF